VTLSIPRKGTTLIDLAESMLAYSWSVVCKTKNGQTGVTHFMVEASRARRFDGRRCPEDPIFGLPRIVEALREDAVGVANKGGG
jgi:hypothetical protein